jgi:colanic acid biosynthesis glycosyl transferase WcaI
VRILVVTQYFWPENFRINDLVAELTRRGHEVTVLTGRPNYPGGAVFPEFRASPDSFAKFAGAQVVRAPMVARGNGSIRLMLNYLSFAISASLVGLWKLRKQRFDAIFAYEPSPITVGIPAVALRAWHRAPLAFWVLDLWPETLHAIGVVRSPRLLALIGKVVQFIYNRCDLILAQSKSFVPQIARYCTRGRPIEYFPSWAESVFDLQGVAPAMEVPLRAGSFDVMFAGNIGDAQDFPAILAAAEKLRSHPRVRWLIVGDGRVAEWVRAQIVARNLQHCVLMLGKYPVERMPSFYKHANALLVSLKDEPIFAMTIPGKLQSYLAAGVPVVAMLNGEGADLVERAGAGATCNAGDAEGLAAAVLRLVALPEAQIQTMGRNASKVSAAEFDRATLMSWLETRLDELQRARGVTRRDS